MIAFGDFRSLVSFFGFCGWFWYGLTVLGLLVLRSREPNLPRCVLCNLRANPPATADSSMTLRPYKTYLITPITFCCVALFLIFMPIFSAPLETLMACSKRVSPNPFHLTTAQHSRATLKSFFRRSLHFCRIPSLPLHPGPAKAADHHWCRTG